MIKFFLTLSYLMLAIIRYSTICLDSGYRLHQYVTEKANWRTILLFSFLILVPAVIWPLIMFYGSDATGKAYHLQLSTPEMEVVAFQDIGEKRGQRRSPFLVLIICFHVIQFFGTITVYIKIIYIGYKSTTVVATREVEDETIVKETPPKTINLGRANIINNNIELKEMNHIPANNQPGVKTISHQVKEQDTNSTTREINPSSINRTFLNTTHSGGRKTYLQPKKGDHVVHIPLSNIVFCVSQKDIVCTIGLFCQLTGLVLTFILTILGFRISGKIVPIDNFFPAYYCLESALIINSLIDPIICVAFSGNFRTALLDMIYCRKIRTNT